MTGGPATEDAARAYETATQHLDAGGRSWADVARVSEFVTVGTGADLAELASVRAAAFGAATPAVATVIVHPLDTDRSTVQVELDVDMADSAGRGPLRPVLDGAVYLPTIVPVGDDGEVVHPGDFRSQYAWCLERAATVLASMGLGPDHLVQTVDYSTPATRDVYSKCGRPRRELLGPVFPGAAGILTPALPHPDALVAFDLVASRYKPVAVNPGWARYETLTYNPAVRAGRALFCSGFAALDPVSQTAVHVDDPAGQAEATYRSILEVLVTAGAGPSALVGVREFVTPGGAPGLAALAEGRARALGGVLPPLTTVGCDALLRPEFLLEVIPVASL